MSYDKLEFTVWLETIESSNPFANTNLLVCGLFNFMNKIYLNGIKNGVLFVMIDEEHYEELNKVKWYFDGHYAYGRPEKKLIRMHRHIMKPSSKLVIDHINHNKLDNRKSNLRICTQRENMANRNPNSKYISRKIIPKINYKKSIFKGVSWSKKDQTWRTRINHLGNQLFVGNFDKEIDAHIAYLMWK